MGITNGDTAKSVAGIWALLPGWAKVVTLIAGIFGGGWTAHAAVSGAQMSVEYLVRSDSLQNQRLTGVEVDIDNVEWSLNRLERKVDRIICLQEAAAGQHGVAQCAR